jgi:hypothetical protein
MKIRRKSLRFAGILLGALACTGVQAADTFFDFDTSNPTNAGSGFMIAGGHAAVVWCSGEAGAPTNGNPNTGGYLSIADGNIFNPGQGCVVVFPDIDGGYPIKAFHLTADVRAGNSGNGDGRPADGFSISYCREGDQVLVNATNGVAGGAAGGDSAAEATSPLGSGDLENGAKSGVAICFDAWQGNWLPDTGAGGTPGPDVEGIEIRVDDHTLRQINMQADRNGSCYYPTNTDCGPAVCGDTNTEQTGPWANDGGFPDGAGTLDGLCWARLDVELTTNKQVTVIWKGAVLVDHFQLTNYPNHRGRLVLMGRTGGNGQNAHFDNIHLVTIPAIEATFDGVRLGPGLNQFTAIVSDNPPSVVTNIPTIILDGTNNVTGSCTVVKNGNVNTITYTQGPFFNPRTTHTVNITWQTSLGQTLNGQNAFLVPGYLVLPPSYAVPSASVDLGKPGFIVTPWQNSAAEPNRNYWADQQQMGLHGTNEIDFTTAPITAEANGFVWDYAIDFANAGAGGQFPLDQSWSFLGIPAPTQANDNNSSAAWTSFLYFPVAGSYYIGANSDDGVRLTFYKNAKDVLGTGLAPELSFDGGRGIGANENIGIIYVSQPGYYGSRLLWYNGGGGSAVEFYTTQTPLYGVTNVLVNDTNNPVSLRCFRASSAAPAYVSFASPPLDDDQALANQDLHYLITDDGTTVSPGGVTLTVNGIVRAPVVTKPGGTNVTEVLLVHPASLWPVGTNTVNLAYIDSAGSNVSHNYYFVAAPYATVSTNLWTANGSGYNPGWGLKVFQSPNTNLFNGFDNSVTVANAAMNGLYGTNVAGVGPYVETNVINYAMHTDGTVYNAGNFTNDIGFYGVPGPGMTTIDNNAFAANSFIEFPSAGFWLMGVNSDDGFRLSIGDRTSPGVSAFEVIAPASIAGERVGIETSSDIHGFGARLPQTPIIAQCIVCDPLNASTALNNAAAVAGKIALCQRGPGFGAQSLTCYQAGAIAVIGTLGPGDVGQLPSFRGGTATVPIPCVEISYEDGTNLIAHGTTTTSSPLVVRVSDDCSQKLGEFNGGRGSTDTLFGVLIPQAGLYPMRLLYEDGGGDANCEFFTVDTGTGIKTLINDPTSTVKSWQNRVFPTGGARFNPAVLSGTSATISWVGEGELMYSYSILGPWRKAANQNNPQVVNVSTIGIPEVFYRIRSY